MEPVAELLAVLVAECGARPERLCRRVIGKAAGTVAARGQPSDGLVQHLLACQLLLNGAHDCGRESEGVKGEGVMGEGVVSELAQELVQQVCLPYLSQLLRGSGLPEDVRMVAAMLASLLLHPQLKGSEVTAGILKDTLTTTMEEEEEEGKKREKSENRVSEKAVPFLCSLFACAAPHQLEHMPAISHQLSALFSLVLRLLPRCAPTTLNLLSSSLLPSLLSPAHPHRLTALWQLVNDVLGGRVLVEGSPLGLSLSLLCSFSDLFIARNKLSPFAGAFSAQVLDLCPLLDVRGEGAFWGAIQRGLGSGDPLDRKRGMYLLHRVLGSVQGGGWEGVGEGEVFWWGREWEGQLDAVCSDLLLILETMEEKQVECDVCGVGCV